MTDQNPLVSIIIPTYNRAYLIGETLDSVLAQTYQNWECIVVDDGSTDDTEEVMADYIAKDSRFQYHHRPKDRLPGGNAARNYGFEVSKGEFIQWFDSDDLMHPELLSICVKRIRNKQSDFVITNFQKRTQDGKIITNPNFPPIEKIHAEFLCQRANLNTLTFFYSRNALHDIIFNEKLKNAQDLDFISRFLQLGNKGFISNEQLFTVRIHQKTITSKFKNKEKEAVLTEIKVRMNNLRYALEIFNNADIAIMRQKLLVKTLFLIKIDKMTFVKTINIFYKNNILSLKVTVKILVLALVYLVMGKGKESYKRTAYNG